MNATISRSGKHMPVKMLTKPPVYPNPGIARKLRVLVACEFSGRVRDAFTGRGHYAMSCDFKNSETPGEHYRGDVRDILMQRWDMMIAFPPCTYLSVIANKDAKWNVERRKNALEFVRLLMGVEIEYIAIENPVGAINSQIRKPDQIINPWMFGDPWNKRTCLWLKGLPLLKADRMVQSKGHYVDGGTRVQHKDREYGDSKFGNQNELERQEHRGKTFLGIARAMSEQWG